MTPVNRQYSISAYSTLSHTATSRRERGSSLSPEGFIVRQKSRGRTIVCNGVRYMRHVRDTNVHINL